MTTTAVSIQTAPTPSAARRGRHPLLPLVFISLAQLMVALDATVINIALPSAQHSLHISDAGRQWVVTAYTLSFGGLLLLGGRLADTLGRKRTFLVGLIGFAAASAAGGVAPSFAPLLAARAVQGAFAALLAPTVLSLLALSFTEAKERARAFAIFGAIAGTGGALGLLLGGVLTEYAQWRWCLFINVPVAAIAFIGGAVVLPDAGAAHRVPLDVRGALLATSGLVAIVYGLSQAASKGWGALAVAGSLIAGVVLIGGFVIAERRTDAPLLPLRLLADRDRAGSVLTMALTVIGMYGLFLLLTYYLQVVRAYSPARAGVAFLPLSVSVMVSSTVLARRLLPRVRPATLVVPGLLVAAAGLGLLTRIGLHSSYLWPVLPGEVLLGAGMGCVFVPAISSATSGVGPRDAGIASAIANTAQQFGASVGTALLNTVAAGATAGYLAARGQARAAVPAGLVHGYAVAAGWAAAILAAAAVMAAVLIRSGPPAPAGSPHPTPDATTDAAKPT